MQPSQTNALININVQNNFCSGVGNCNGNNNNNYHYGNNNNYHNGDNNNYNNGGWWGAPVYHYVALPILRAWTPGWCRGGGYWGGGARLPGSSPEASLLCRQARSMRSSFAAMPPAVSDTHACMHACTHAGLGHGRQLWGRQARGVALWAYSVALFSEQGFVCRILQPGRHHGHCEQQPGLRGDHKCAPLWQLAAMHPVHMPGLSRMTAMTTDVRWPR